MSAGLGERGIALFGRGRAERKAARERETMQAAGDYLLAAIADDDPGLMTPLAESTRSYFRQPWSTSPSVPCPPLLRSVESG